MLAGNTLDKAPYGPAYAWQRVVNGDLKLMGGPGVGYYVSMPPEGPDDK